ncbi:MAG: type 4a pilus biogenesis protein PilO [candidate division NC10 bacterium]|nr:type 4a pilus biogenesis protein PilO [candidate division NC10 bacterium]
MALDLKAFFANAPKKQLYLLGGVAGAAIVALYAYFLMMPLWEEKGKFEDKLRKVQSDLQQKQLIAANRPKLEAEIKALEKQLDEALVRLPEEKDIPRLLTQINTLGQQNGLEFLLFRPGTPAKKGFYAEVPIDIRVEGQFHSMGGFLDRVSKLERIVTVSDIKITPLSAQAQRTDRSIAADLKATTYTFLEKGGSTDAPKK